MNKAFTIIEILVYTAVLVLIMTAVGAVLFWSLKLQTKTKIITEVSINAEVAMQAILREIQNGQSIYAPSSVFGSNPGQLSIKTKNYAQGEDYSYIDFFLCEARLCFKKEGQNSITITSSTVEINNLIFSLIGSGDFKAVQITLGIQYNSSSIKPEYNAQETIQSTAAIRSPKP